MPNVQNRQSTEAGESSPANQESHTATERTRRPRGVVLLPFLMILNGLFLIGQHIPIYLELWRDVEGKMSLSPAFQLNLVGETLLAATAIVGSTSLFFGFKWGWVMSALFFPWTIVRELLMNARIDHYGDVEGEGFPTPLVVRIVLFSLITIYLFRHKVLAYVGLTTLHRAWSAFGIVLGGAAIAWILDPLDGLFAMPSDF